MTKLVWTKRQRETMREELAEWVEYTMFFNGRERATRLLLIADVGGGKLPRDLGGLCRDAVVGRIEEYIVARFVPRGDMLAKKQRGSK